MKNSSSTPVVEVSDLTVAYGEKPVLWDVDLQVPASTLMAIVGPNGAGKTTLIKSILGLIPIAAGQIQISGRPYAEMRQQVGYVPQRSSVDWDFPTSVLDVVMMGRYWLVFSLRSLSLLSTATPVLKPIVRWALCFPSFLVLA